MTGCRRLPAHGSPAAFFRQVAADLAACVADPAYHVDFGSYGGGLYPPSIWRKNSLTLCGSASAAWVALSLGFGPLTGWLPTSASEFGDFGFAEQAAEAADDAVMAIALVHDGEIAQALDRLRWAYEYPEAGLARSEDERHASVDCLTCCAGSFDRDNCDWDDPEDGPCVEARWRDLMAGYAPDDARQHRDIGQVHALYLRLADWMEAI